MSPRANWSLLDCELLWAYSADVADQHRAKWSDQHGFLSARRFLRGGGVYTFGRETIRTGPGEWLFTPDGRYHQRLSADARHESIRFRLHWPTGRPLFRHERPLRIPVEEAREFTRLSTRLCSRLTGEVIAPTLEFRRVPGDALAHLRLEAEFQVWIVTYAELMRKAGVAENDPGIIDPRVADAVAYVDARSRHESVEVMTLARRAGLSVSRFNRLFVAETGQTPSAFVAQRRMHRVVRALLGEGAALKTLAYEMGFGSPAHFSRWFKTQAGVSPRRWLREMTQQS